MANCRDPDQKLPTPSPPSEGLYQNSIPPNFEKVLKRI
jgi:hypothetical protein